MAKRRKRRDDGPLPPPLPPQTRTVGQLAIVFFLGRFGLGFLLRSQGDNTIRTAVFLADVVLSPVLFLGAALLYFDQAARVESSGRPTRRSHADVRAAEHAD